MHDRRSTDLPLCPACLARHMPASNGAGQRIWCDGRPAENRLDQEMRIAHERMGSHALVDRARHNLEQAKARKRIRKEKTQRADAPPIDSIDQARIPDGI